MQARNIRQIQARAWTDPKSPVRRTTLHHVKSFILRILLA